MNDATESHGYGPGGNAHRRNQIFSPKSPDLRDQTSGDSQSHDHGHDRHDNNVINRDDDRIRAHEDRRDVELRLGDGTTSLPIIIAHLGSREMSKLIEADGGNQGLTVDAVSEITGTIDVVCLLLHKLVGVSQQPTIGNLRNPCSWSLTSGIAQHQSNHQLERNHIYSRSIRD
jgi:hypothetical protein